MDVVKQDDALATAFDPGDRPRTHLITRRLEVILGIDIDVDHDNPVAGEIAPQRRGAGEIGKTEERCHVAASDCRSDALSAALDLGFRVCGAHSCEIAVRLGVGADRMAARGNLASDGRIGVRHLADHQERRLDAVAVERGQDLFRAAGHRAVVECQDNLLVAQRDVGDPAYAERATGKAAAGIGREDQCGLLCLRRPGTGVLGRQRRRHGVSLSSVGGPRGIRIGCAGAASHEQGEKQGTDQRNRLQHHTHSSH